MLTRPRAVAALAGLALLAAVPAGAATPDTKLAATLKNQMQKYYDKQVQGLKMTTVVCKIVPAGTSATCTADFTVVSKRAAGIFKLSVKINRKTGSISTKTTSAKCFDSKTHAKLTC
jgi:hypothetical protein